MFIGKNVVVTGASKGIGFAISKKFSESGANVFLLASNDSRLSDAAEMISSKNGKKVNYFAQDLRSEKGCELAYSNVLKVFDGVDILINSAGATKAGSFVEQPDSEMVDGFSLKFYSAVRLCRLFWPKLKESAGTVINIVGGFARTPDPDFIVGTCVNSALATFSKALAGQGLRDDINVNWIHPGITVTDRMHEIFSARSVLEGQSVESIMKNKIKEENIRRLGQPNDVASLVEFLCRPEARHINGAGIPIDGGGSKGYY